jgi:hypothetical protein
MKCQEKTFEAEILDGGVKAKKAAPLKVRLVPLECA